DPLAAAEKPQGPEREAIGPKPPDRAHRDLTGRREMERPGRHLVRGRYRRRRAGVRDSRDGRLRVGGAEAVLSERQGRALEIATVREGDIHRKLAIAVLWIEVG